MLENAEIAIPGLPAVADLEWRPLARGYTRKLHLHAALTAAAAALAALMFQVVPLNLPIPPAAVLWALIAVGTLAGIAWPAVSVPRKGWAMRELDLVYRSGVLWRAEHAVPFNRVQHVETASTPLDRAFDVATLHLYTAGGSGSDLTIHGLAADVAERLRLFVLERAGADIAG